MGPHTLSRRQVLGMGLGLAAGPLARQGRAFGAGFDWISWNNLIFAVVLAGPRLQTLPSRCSTS